MWNHRVWNAIVLVMLLSGAAGARARDCQEVYEARAKGLPKTAIAALAPIFADALANTRHAEAMNAVCLRIAFEGEIEGNKPEEKIVRLQEEIAKAAAEMQPVMKAILAVWSW